MIPPQPTDICQWRDCGRIRASTRHAPCIIGMCCVCDSNRDHALCHDFVEPKEATK